MPERVTPEGPEELTGDGSGMPLPELSDEERVSDAPEPTYGNQPPVAPVVAPEAPPPAGATYAEDGHAVITAEEFRLTVEREYGHWVATEDIAIDGVPAFRRGDPVPKGHVDSGAVRKESVVGRNTKTANSLFDDLNGRGE